MPYTILTTTNIRLDIKDAINWENSRKSGLGLRFLNELDQKLLSISKMPYIAAVRYENVRCFPTRTFHYLLHYIVDDENEKIYLLRVLHTSKEPFR